MVSPAPGTPPGPAGSGILNVIGGESGRGDLFGGLTAAVVALPMALAFGVASGAGPVAGLWSAAIIGLVAALFGGTPALISEPTGPMTVVFTAVLATLSGRLEDPAQALAVAFTVVMVAGVFQILYGLLRLGDYITQMPYTVISGFMSGVGTILMILQIAPLLGEPAPPGGVLGTLGGLPELLQGIRPMDSLLALITLGVLGFTPAAVRRFLPVPLFALIVGTSLSLLAFPGVELRRIGTIPSGLPHFTLPAIPPDVLQLVLVNAALLGLLGSIDCLLTCLVSDSLTRMEHRSNKELVGQGLANIAAGLFGALPGSGATTATVVNIQAGGRTGLSGILRALILALVILGGSGLASRIPLAVLAAIVFQVGFGIVDWGFLARVPRLSRRGALITYVVTALTVLVDLMVAVGVGVFIANILTIDTLNRRQAGAVQTISTGNEADDRAADLSVQERELLDQARGRVLLFQLNGAMIFGVAKTINREHNAIGDCDAVIFDLSAVFHLGLTAALAIENAVEEAIEAGRNVYVVGAQGTTRQRLEEFRLFEKLPDDHTDLTRHQALMHAVAALPAADAPQPELQTDCPA
ncbi:SulP family inorganic anion transporter [Cyanobium sp. CH-040]|uniref:SulP family inorganic anion transporter n=1 Tax=Cyanobium sp. CH-040 TaxID=2823708 RepID=UPI0020CBB93F|nr:SulP family inorganic anion transporter [Cyanobium sp. CH-040]MCP9929061.1 SulP family inorganic anion transporter [Cyanobium sp. CH-040]